MGDFNETLYGEEHFSNTPRPEWQMRAFREAVEDCSLQDLGWTGVAYTWDNRQTGPSNVKARLDRGLANADFLQRFEHVRVRHICTAESDHCMVLVELRENLRQPQSGGAKQFRYVNVWQTHVDYDRLVAESWLKNQNPQGLQGVVDCLNSLHKELEPWGAREFGCLAKKVRKLQQQLDKLRRRSVGRGPSDEEKTVVKQLREALRQEETWMRQRSRVQWLREGDRNTAYFHAQASHWKRINRIAGLRRQDGSVCDSEVEDKLEVQAFYQTLYTSQGYNDMSELLNLVPTRVTSEMNSLLDKPFEAEEVRAALFQMAPSKAPGVDGFTAGFFQRHWDILHHTIVPAVLDFLKVVSYQWDLMILLLP
jgi:hypothetical protein